VGNRGESGGLFGTDPVETWTVDGQTLDAIMFVAGIPDGEPIMRVAAVKSEELPRFRSAMTPNDIMDLFEATFQRSSKTAVVSTRNLRPVKLGDVDGFRFELSFSPKDDVDRDLSAVGAVRGGKLYIIAYHGTRLYHFNKYLPEFERILGSVRFAAS